MIAKKSFQTKKTIQIANLQYSNYACFGKALWKHKYFILFISSVTYTSLQCYNISKHNKYFREDANGTLVFKHVKSRRLGKNVKQVFTWIVWLYKNNGNMSGLVQTKSVVSSKVKKGFLTYTSVVKTYPNYRFGIQPFDKHRLFFKNICRLMFIISNIVFYFLFMFVFCTSIPLWISMCSIYQCSLLVKKLEVIFSCHHFSDYNLNNDVWVICITLKISLISFWSQVKTKNTKYNLIKRH